MSACGKTGLLPSCHALLTDMTMINHCRLPGRLSIDLNEVFFFLFFFLFQSADYHFHFILTPVIYKICSCGIRLAMILLLCQEIFKAKRMRRRLARPRSQGLPSSTQTQGLLAGMMRYFREKVYFKGRRAPWELILTKVYLLARFEHAYVLDYLFSIPSGLGETPL